MAADDVTANKHVVSAASLSAPIRTPALLLGRLSSAQTLEFGYSDFLAVVVIGTQVRSPDDVILYK